MKKLLILFMSLLSVLSFWILYSERSREEFFRVRDLESEIGEEFFIPEYGYFLDYEVVYPWLLETAEEFDANIFRSSQISEDEINKFILLTNETAFWDYFGLRTGSVLSNEETQGGDRFLATMNSGDENQAGQIVYFGNRTTVTVTPLVGAFETLVPWGRYFAELPTGTSLESFLSAFSERVNTYLSEIYDEEIDYFGPEDFQVEDIQSSGMQFDLNWENQILIFMMVATLIIGMYFVASQAKKISILKLNGLSTAKIWNQVIGKVIYLTFTVTLLAGIAIATILGFIYRDFGFLLEVAIRQLLIFGIFLGLSFGVCMMIKRISIQQGVKNKNSTRFVFGMNSLIKIGLTVVVVVIGFSLLELRQNMTERELLIENWADSGNYGVFAPVRGTVHERDEKGFAIYQELYPTLNEMGMLMIDARDYQQWDLEDNGVNDGDHNRMTVGIEETGDYWRYLTVNPNFLNAFPIYDIYGEVVEISEDDQRVILLFPEKYKGREDEMLIFFKWNREWQLDINENWYNIPVSEELRQAEFHIIWLADDQEVFSFNPDVFPENYNNIVNPLIRVATLANSVGEERIGVMGSVAREAWKIKAIDGDLVYTMEVLRPILRELEIESFFPRLVTINEEMLEEISQLRTVANLVAFIGMLIATAATALGLQNTALFFRQYKQKFVIKRVFGADFLGTYRKYFYYFGALWFIQMPLIIVIATVLNIQISWTLCLFLLGLELILSSMMIQLLEKKNKLAVLKGED